MRWSIAAISLAIVPNTTVFAASPHYVFLSQGEGNISRAEAVYRIVESNSELSERTAWYRSHMPPLPLFHDVPQGDAFAPYLEAAFEAGIVPGNRERLFHPTDSLRMEEAQAMIRRFRGEEDHAETEDVVFFVQPMARENFFTLLHNGPMVASSSAASHSVSSVSSASSWSATSSELSVVSSVSSVAPSSDLFAISIPALGIERLQVSHPEDPMTHAGIIEPLKRGVGHLFGYPGGGGKVMVYGHSSGYPWDVSAYTRVFRRVNRLAPDDTIELLYQGRRFTYRVTGQERVAADDLRPFQEEDSGEELILYTCWPPDSTSERLLVRAIPVKPLSL